MKPVCSRCNDTHMMPRSEEREVMCTFCPVPCQSCRAGGNGPYCTTTPCPCKCHRKHGARTSEIDLNDARRRCRDMATKPEGGHGRNLSVNDQDAIVRVLSYVSKLETEVSMRRDEMERMRRQRDAPPASVGFAEHNRASRPPLGPPSAPLIPQSRADAMVAEEREAIAREFERAAEAIEANARDPSRPNVGCTTQECLEAAQDERAIAAAIRARKTETAK